MGLQSFLSSFSTPLIRVRLYAHALAYTWVWVKEERRCVNRYICVTG